MIRISEHGKQRLKERTEIPRGNQKRFVYAGRYNGVPLEQVQDPALRNELIIRFQERRSIVRYYNGYVFVFSKTNVMKTVVKV